MDAEQYERCLELRDAKIEKLEADLASALNAARKSPLEKLDNLIAIQSTDGNWDQNGYMRGLANGLIMARSCFTDETPAFLEARTMTEAQKDAMTETEAAQKLANLFRQLWRDAEEESRLLRTLLTGAQEEVCSLTCRSHFPAGHVHSEADHSDKCRAITNALTDANADAEDRISVGDDFQKAQSNG